MLTLSEQQINQAAEQLYRAEKCRSPVEPATLAYPDMTIDDG